MLTNKIFNANEKVLGMSTILKTDRSNRINNSQTGGVAGVQIYISESQIIIAFTEGKLEY